MHHSAFGRKERTQSTWGNRMHLYALEDAEKGIQDWLGKNA